MKPQIHVSFLTLLMLSLLLAGITLGQETTGSVRGTVTDSTGAAIAGATVELSGERILRPLSVATDAVGVFRFLQVPPGAGYSVSATAPGFRVAKASGIGVELGKATT